MSSFKWIANSLKNLRITGTGGGSQIIQARSPPLASTSQEAATTASSIKPKRPMGPFLRYLKDIRPQVIQQNPSLKPKDIIRVVGQQWSALGEDKKENYSKGFQAELSEYTVLMNKYKSSLTYEEKKEQVQTRLNKSLKREKRELKQRLKELGKPKQPPTSFIRFAAATSPKSHTPEDLAANCKAAGKKWKTMTDAEKAPYVSAYEKDRETYFQEMKKWEKKMMAEGNHDLIRQQASRKKSVVDGN